MTSYSTAPKYTSDPDAYSVYGKSRCHAVDLACLVWLWQSRPGLKQLSDQGVANLARVAFIKQEEHLVDASFEIRVPDQYDRHWLLKLEAVAADPA